MKIIAFILIVSMVSMSLSLSLNRFMDSPDLTAPQTELSCDMDCCCQPDDGCKDHEACEDNPDKSQRCNCGCDCSISVQLVAIGQNFPAPIELAPKVFSHGSFSENCQSEYLSPYFQPPRIA